MPDPRSLLTRYALVGLVLGLLMAFWWGIGRWDVHRARTAAAPADGRVRVQAEVAATFRQMEALAARASSLALAHGSADGEDALVEAMVALDVPPHVAVEVYTPAPALVAWKGFAMPLGDPVGSVQFLRVPQTALVRDGEERSALVLWQPVRAGGRLVGAVRVVRLVEQRVPVQNRYLRGYDAAAEWGGQIAWGAGPDTQAASPETDLLRGPDGTVVGRVLGAAGNGKAPLVQAERRRRGVRAFWAVLLLGWAMAGAVGGVRRLERAALAGGRGRWTQWGLATASAFALWVGMRYGLLVLDVPARWLPTGADTPAWFDPGVLASGLGGGLARSVADLTITAAFALAASVALLRAALVARRNRPGLETGAGRAVGGGAAVGLFSAVAGVGLAALARVAVFDATLPYFDQGGPIADPLVLAVFAALLAVATAVALLAGAGWTLLAPAARTTGAAAAGVALGVLAALAVPAVRALLPAPTAFGLAGIGVAAAAAMAQSPRRWAGFVTLRGLVLGVILLSTCTYPTLFRATEALQREQMVEGAEPFADGRDARVVFAVEQVLRDARSDAALRSALTASPAALDSLAADLVNGSLLAALDDYTVALTLRGPDGRVLGGFSEVPPPGEPPATENGMTFASLVRYHAVRGRPASAVPPMQPAGRPGLFRYAGIAPVEESEGAWAVVRAEPRSPRYLAGTPFPQALVPTSLVEEGEAGLSYAAYAGGVLTRSQGPEPSAFRLDPGIRTLPPGARVWRVERSEAGSSTTLYERSPSTGEVIAVRARRPVLFDHLYALLRVALGGAALGALAFVLGAVLRRRAGLLPPPRVRFRDKVLDRFLVVGVLAVGLTGAVGQRVIEGQNRAGVEERLRRQLQSVEAALRETVRAPQAGANPLQTPLPLERSLERARPDVVGPQLGLDVHLYRGPELVGSSRSQLVRQRLIERRMPIGVYAALFVEGRRYAFAEEHVGTYAYTTGYKALVDGAGRVVGAVAVPTLPEQAALDAEQAQMVAYLFGALLVLLVVVFLTATLLATQLTRPFARLREGLQAVGEGTDVAPIPVDAPDEIGELVETFNRMQRQLAESRRQLAAQERELAWREMARQVAHEIKNPLTPMKLSVQHLGRAYQKALAAKGAVAADPRFADLFGRVTATLEEQIDALARIAGAFSSFGRLPQQRLETVDLSAVVQEAARLVEAEAASVEAGPGGRAHFTLDLAPAPLPVRADREELRRVFINLFKNALQALPEGREQPGRIDARTALQHDGPAGPSAIATVADDGTGIAPDVQARIFEPRFSTKTSGMGLGLAITKKAIEDLRGQIGFETAEGVGTTFRVTLPLASDQEE